MKTTLLSALLLAVGFAACVAPAQPTYRGNDGYGYNDRYDEYPNDNRYDDGNYDEFDEYAYRDFYDDLRPYGRWMNYPEYGQVWAPNAGPDFMPYSTNGYWTYTNYGWTWVSDYAWGWGPFHYGRWFFDDRAGWLWRPGRQWAPAWVAWGQTNGYYGWAPLFPGVNINVNIGFNRFPRRYWTFVPCQHLYNRNWRGYAVRNNTTIINNNVTIINNYGDRYGRPSRDGRGSYWRGPQVQDVERYGNTRIRPLRVENSNRPGSSRVEGDRVTVYRPNTNSRPEGVNRPGRDETSSNTAPSTRPGNGRWNRSGWGEPGAERPNAPAPDGTQRSDRPTREQNADGIGTYNRGTERRWNDTWSNRQPSTTQPAEQPQTYEQPRARPNVERPDWGSNSRSPERQQGTARPDNRNWDRSWDRPNTDRPAERPAQSQPVERPNWGENRRIAEPPARTESPSRPPERPSGDWQRQAPAPQPQRESAPAGRQDSGGNSSSGERPGRSRGPR